jgi:hypothetical protein
MKRKPLFDVLAADNSQNKSQNSQILKYLNGISEYFKRYNDGYMSSMNLVIKLLVFIFVNQLNYVY